MVAPPSDRSADRELTVDHILGPNSPLARRLAGYELREGQLEMARAVHEALVKDRHLLVEAGTGTGKTFAYLVPAVLSGRKVVISTATHALQEQIFEKDIPFVRGILAEHGIELRAALMKGLSNYVCKRRFHERLRNGEPVTGELAAIEKWALGEARPALFGTHTPPTQTGDRAELAFLSEHTPAWRDVQSGTDTRIGAGCKYFDECFVTKMKRDAENAQIVVVNHHLFFADLALKTGKGGGFGGAIPPYDAVVFDEAHQIESVATDFFGVRVSSTRVDRLLRDARNAVLSARALDSHAMRIVDNVEHSGQLFFRSWIDEHPAAAKREERRLLAPSEWTQDRRDTTKRFDAALQALTALALAHDEDDALAMIARRAGELRADLARVYASSEEKKKPDRHWEPDDHTPPPAFDDDDPGVPSIPPSMSWRHPQQDLLIKKAIEGFEGGVTWVEARGPSTSTDSNMRRHVRDRERAVSLGASPVDLAPLLRERLFDRVPSIICTSATLATATHAGPSFHFARGRLGALADTGELVVPSPFDFEARAALYIAEDLPEPSAANTNAFEEACAKRARELADVTGGGAFVLCTSNRAMRAIYHQMSKIQHDGGRSGPLLIQGEAPKHVLLDRFRTAGDAILVATMSFWEGVDVPGRALRLVIIDKIPFAVPTEPVVAARSAKIEAEGGNPFTQYSVPAAAITLKQGFGRLIRTKKDAGIVALLDRRAVKRGYGRALLESLPPARRLRKIEEVRDFWQSID